MEDKNYIENILCCGDQSEEEEEDAEEALSLCDLPLDNIHDQVNEFHDMSSKHLHARRSSADQFFEFFSEFSTDSFMCSAEDIIVCGKLIPFKDHANEAPQKTCTNNGYHKKNSSFRRRSESLPGLQSSVARSSSTKNQIMIRNSRSLDYQKLHRKSSMVSPTPAEMERISSVKSVGKYDKKCGNKPKWFLLMFGIVRFQAEMDLSDIKNRQIRRNPSTLFRSEAPDNRSSGKGSWKLLKVLSCKDHASVAAKMPHCTQA
ncbi:hypothetical protein ACFX13_023069 [Malus domestica]|uniref:uncharacterized protein LOC126608435 n=1 Tax=Malus sylvestris TaxID=3752 RepID=UPI0021AD2618|nr:uncharacterized protein LOC126608435 [Malus sylvestris]